MNTVELVLDDDAGVLYVKRPGVDIVDAEEVPPDFLVILNQDANGNIVGAQVLHADHMPREYWNAHPGRASLPQDIQRVVDDWFLTRLGD